jgi:hypothetical protein
MLLVPHAFSLLTSLRPLTLMSNFRKILELIILDQIYPSVDIYISPNQSARRDSSTANILWTYQYQAAFAERYTKVVHFLGIDLTKAFDTVDRTLLLDILQPIISSSSYTMLQYLMSATQLFVKFGTNASATFPATHGIPQGGALSTILFAAYMEEPLQYIYRDGQTFFREQQNSDNTFITTSYVDDCDCISSGIILSLSLMYFYPPTSFLGSPLSINKRLSGTPSPKAPTSLFTNSALTYVLTWLSKTS